MNSFRSKERVLIPFEFGCFALSPIVQGRQRFAPGSVLIPTATPCSTTLQQAATYRRFRISGPLSGRASTRRVATRPVATRVTASARTKSHPPRVLSTLSLRAPQAWTSKAWSNCISPRTHRIRYATSTGLSFSPMMPLSRRKFVRPEDYTGMAIARTRRAPNKLTPIYRRQRLGKLRRQLKCALRCALTHRDG